eukprot:SAG31_NODE_3275_length_4474_cov_17.108114_4_plen_84_part_00
MADYSIDCYDDDLISKWWILAAVASFGIIFISVGVPLGMLIWMRSSMKKEMALVLEKEKSRVTAYRDFGRRFNFIAGEFRPEA